MDLGLMGAVMASCWLAYRFNALSDDVDDPGGRALVLRMITSSLAGGGCLVAIVMMLIIALALSGDFLGLDTADYYLRACQILLGIVSAAEIALTAYRAQSASDFGRPAIARIQPRIHSDVVRRSRQAT